MGGEAVLYIATSLDGLIAGPDDDLSWLTRYADVDYDFEAFFAGAYFEQMFAGVQPDSITGGGEGESMFRSLMIQEYGKAVAKQRVLGIADVVKRQLLALQEQQ